MVLGESRTIGESSTHEGVKFTPSKYLLLDEVERGYENNSRKISGESGAMFLLTHVSVSHEGDAERELPQNGLSDWIFTYYKGERVDDGGQRALSTDYYKAGGKTLDTYQSALYDADATGGVYPGKEVEGWIFNEIAANFDPSELELHLIWNNKPFGDDGETTHKWTYTEHAEVSIEDVEDDSSITL